LILTDAAIQRVVAALTEQSVIPWLSEQQVCTRPPVHNIVATAGADHIVPPQTEDGVVA
jgi:hypothetical protein